MRYIVQVVYSPDKLGVEAIKKIGYPIIDCRRINNPWLRKFSDKTIKERVPKLLGFEECVQEGLRYLYSGYITIYVGGTYGCYRSVVVAQEISRRYIGKLRVR